MNTHSKPTSTTPDVGKSDIVLDDIGRPLSRKAMHFYFWYGLFCTLIVCIVMFIIQKLIKVLPPDAPLRQILFYPLVIFFAVAVPPLLVSLATRTVKQPQKTSANRSKRILVRFILFCMFVIPAMVWSEISYQSRVQPSNWLFNILPKSTPTWDAFWQSLVLNPLSLIVIAVPSVVGLIQTYRDQLKAMGKQKNTSDE